MSIKKIMNISDYIEKKQRLQPLPNSWVGDEEE